MISADPLDHQDNRDGIPHRRLLDSCVRDFLDQRGFEVVLVNARDARHVPGRKTDVSDAQWLQRLHVYGLLRASFRPHGEIMALRAYLRQRERLLDYAAAHDAVRFGCQPSLASPSTDPTPDRPRGNVAQSLNWAPITPQRTGPPQVVGRASSSTPNRQNNSSGNKSVCLVLQLLVDRVGSGGHPPPS